MLPIYLELAFQLFRICTAYVDDVRRLMQSEHRELLYLRQAPWALFKPRSDRPCWGKSTRSRKIRVVVVTIRGWMSPALTFNAVVAAVKLGSRHGSEPRPHDRTRPTNRQMVG
jgi:hypothetical protein